MSIDRWLRPLAARLGRRTRPAAARPLLRPYVEGLEDRAVPTSFTVTNTRNGFSKTYAPNAATN